MFLLNCTQPVEELKRVGPASSRLLARLEIHSLEDLLRHYPRDYQDRRQLDPLSAALQKERINCLVRVVSREWIGRGYRKTLRVEIADDTGSAFLVCFGRDYLKNVLLPGRQFLVSGSFNPRFATVQSTNFDLEPYGPKSLRFGRILPLYPLTEGLTQEALRRFVRQALEQVGGRLADELPEGIRLERELLHKGEAVRALHFPSSWEELQKARRTLVFEELFYYQLVLARTRRLRRQARKRRKEIPFHLQSGLLERLPFSLTPDQERVLAEVEADLFSPFQAARLIQGEVGSGKTLVAFLAALSVIEAGEQVAFLAPTELLARQHAGNAARLLEPLGVRTAFLSGSTPAAQRGLLRQSLQAGEIQLLIGTHALFSPDIRYPQLGLVIVDEQHRFGVLQRQAILAKGDHPDLLLLTATPIPRTLAMTVFGDLELSEIRGLPAGRKAVITHLTRPGGEAKVYERVYREIRAGRQAYFIYPLIEESESLQVKDAEGMARRLKAEVFPDLRLGLIHSRLSEEEKRGTMEAFCAGEIQILVATSVLEVGVDVPNASCMVIEQAERFGLSNLHQLRGRVGRGPYQSYAFLIYGEQLSPEAIQRLRVIMATGDGFAIAEEDLKIRGPGDFLGARQSGYLRLGLADPVRDRELFLSARQDALALLEEDPGLIQTQNGACREVLAQSAAQESAALAGVD